MSGEHRDFSKRGQPRGTQRRGGLYRKHRANRVLVISEGECTTPVEIKRATTRQIGLEAAYRGMSPQALMGSLLDTIADDDLFAAVMGDRN